MQVVKFFAKVVSDEGEINTATTTCDTNSGIVTDLDTASINIIGPSIDLEKYVMEGSSWVDSTNANVDDIVSLKITAFNDGGTQLNGTTISDELPPCLEYIEGSANHIPIVYQDNILRCGIIYMGPGQSLEITFDTRAVLEGVQINYANATEHGIFCD